MLVQMSNKIRLKYCHDNISQMTDSRPPDFCLVSLQMIMIDAMVWCARNAMYVVWWMLVRRVINNVRGGRVEGYRSDSALWGYKNRGSNIQVSRRA